MTHKENGDGHPFNPEDAHTQALTPEQHQLTQEVTAAAARIKTEEDCLRLFELTEDMWDFAPEPALLARLEGAGRVFFTETSNTRAITQRHRLETLLFDSMQQMAEILNEKPNMMLHDETARALTGEISRRARKATKTTPIILTDGTLADYTTQEVDPQAIDTLAELGLALRLNTGQLAWTVSDATQHIREKAKRDILEVQEAHEMQISWSELPDLLGYIKIRPPEAGLLYTSEDPVNDILLDTYLFFVADKTDGVAQIPEKSIQEIIKEIKAKGKAKTIDERLFVGLAAELHQWYEDGGYDTFVHSKADGLHPYKGYENSSFYNNSLVVRKDYNENTYFLNNHHRVLVKKGLNMLPFATTCNKVDRLTYLDPPRFIFNFTPNELTIPVFDSLDLQTEGSSTFAPLEIDFQPLIDFCSRITGTKLSDNFYEQLQLQREDLNQKLASPTHWESPAEILIDEAGLSIAQSFNDDVYTKKPQLLADNTLRIWTYIDTYNGKRYYEIPELTISTYQVDDDGIIDDHVQKSARRAAIFKKRMEQIE